MPAEFELVWREILRYEGGHADLPGDPGGDTWYGIASRWHRDKFDSWPPSKEQAEGFYRDWWDRLGMPRRPFSQRIALVYFLFLLNANERAADAAIQMGLCAAGETVTVDGSYGPQTEDAVRFADEQAVYRGLRAAIGMYYFTRPNFARFGRSWLNRLRFRQ